MSLDNIKNNSVQTTYLDNNGVIEITIETDTNGQVDGIYRVITDIKIEFDVSSIYCVGNSNSKEIYTKENKLKVGELKSLVPECGKWKFRFNFTRGCCTPPPVLNFKIIYESEREMFKRYKKTNGTRMCSKNVVIFLHFV